MLERVKEKREKEIQERGREWLQKESKMRINSEINRDKEL